jgi:hypothetical protein
MQKYTSRYPGQSRFANRCCKPKHEFRMKARDRKVRSLAHHGGAWMGGLSRYLRASLTSAALSFEFSLMLVAAEDIVAACSG